jgi:methionyl aminopeptidase
MGIKIMSKPTTEHLKAGRIAAKVLDETIETVESGVKVAKICRFAEDKIIEYGGRPAFPCTVSIDNFAAHYTSPIGDQRSIPNSGLVKVDLGVQLNGYITDTAKTVDLDGDLEGFVYATDDALREAISLFMPGTSLGDIGKKIESVLKQYGLKPIRNLSGHQIERNRLHGEKSVPNVGKRFTPAIEVGECYAIEPYATSGVGEVIDSDLVYIFSNTGERVELGGVTEKLRIHLRKKYGPFPFTARWIRVKSENIDLLAEMRELLKAGAIRGHPVQVSKKGRPVSQSEHTVFVGEDETVTLTSND